MSVLSAIIAAKKQDCVAIGKASYPPATWPSVEVSGVDPIKLSTLHYLASGRSPGRVKTILCALRFRHAGGNKTEGPWLLSIPNSICATFASIDPLHALGIAVAWSETDELQSHEWSIEDAQKFILELSSFARQARKQIAQLFLWLAL